MNGLSELDTNFFFIGTKHDNKVLIPSLTFAKTANAIKYCNAVQHFADVENETLGMCPKKLQNHLKDITDTFGKLRVLSFNENKIITPGRGRAILTYGIKHARRAKHIKTTAKKPHTCKHDQDYVGHKYRQPNINATFGCAQIKKPPHHLAKKIIFAQRYLDVFDSNKFLKYLKSQ